MTTSKPWRSFTLDEIQQIMSGEVAGPSMGCKVDPMEFICKICEAPSGHKIVEDEMIKTGFSALEKRYFKEREDARRERDQARKALRGMRALLANHFPGQTLDNMVAEMLGLPSIPDWARCVVNPEWVLPRVPPVPGAILRAELACEHWTVGWAVPEEDEIEGFRFVDFIDYPFDNDYAEPEDFWAIGFDSVEIV